LRRRETDDQRAVGAGGGGDLLAEAEAGVQGLARVDRDRLGGERRRGERGADGAEQFRRGGRRLSEEKAQRRVTHVAAAVLGEEGRQARARHLGDRIGLLARSAVREERGAAPHRPEGRIAPLKSREGTGEFQADTGAPGRFADEKDGEIFLPERAQMAHGLGPRQEIARRRAARIDVPRAGGPRPRGEVVEREGMQPPERRLRMEKESPAVEAIEGRGAGVQAHAEGAHAARGQVELRGLDVVTAVRDEQRIELRARADEERAARRADVEQQAEARVRRRRGRRIEARGPTVAVGAEDARAQARHAVAGVLTVRRREKERRAVGRETRRAQLEERARDDDRLGAAPQEKQATLVLAARHQEQLPARIYVRQDLIAPRPLARVRPLPGDGVQAQRRIAPAEDELRGSQGGPRGEKGRGAGARPPENRGRADPRKRH